MSGLYPFLISGLTIGAVYGLAASGLVLTYKTSGIFNFAHGSIATLSVFVFYELHVVRGVSWPVCMLVSVVLVGAILGLLLERVARLLDGESHVLKVTVTIGIVISVLAIGQLRYADVVQPFPSYLPTSTVEVGGVYISWDQIITSVVAAFCAVGLWIFFRYVRLGIAMRGVVDDPALLSMTGRSPARVRRSAWMIGAMFASLSGVLIAPSLSIAGATLTLLVVQAFGAAAVGFFRNLPLTFAGGLAIGIAGALATKYSADFDVLDTLPLGLPFIILFAVLVVTPKAKLADRRFTSGRELHTEWHAPGRIRAVMGVVVITIVALAPQYADAKLTLFSMTIASFILLLSLGVLLRSSGQVSLCQYGFAAVGAAAMAHFSHGAGMNWLLALLLAGLVAVPIGALIAIPAIRLSGVFLALATFGFGVLLEQVFYNRGFMFGRGITGLQGRRPEVTILGLDLSSEQGFFYVSLAVAVVCGLLVVALLNGRLGRILRALSDSRTALDTYGSSVSTTQVIVFCFSAWLAALSGALMVSLVGVGTPAQFPAFQSLILVALVTIVPFGTPWYALGGAIGLTLIPGYVGSADVQNWLDLLFGVGAILSPLTIGRHTGAPRFIRGAADRLDRMIPRRTPRRAEPAGVGLVARVAERAGSTRSVVGAGLEVDSLTIRYGGVMAVDDLSLRAPSRSVTGLIGPNGAGKTTTFNACSGLIHVAAGSIKLHGEEVASLGPAARAQRGLGRTFQRAELFNSLTVRQNVLLGRESAIAGRRWQNQLVSSPRQRDEIGDAAERAIELTGIDKLLDVRARDLSTGERRLVELTRVLAGPFDMLLLDEPSAGLDHKETYRFGEIIRRAVDEMGVGVLLVEHDMALVRQICQRIYVLDFGRLIHEGEADAVLRSDIVRAAYLGDVGLPTAGQAAFAGDSR